MMNTKALKCIEYAMTPPAWEKCSKELTVAKKVGDSHLLALETDALGKLFEQCFRADDVGLRGSSVLRLLSCTKSQKTIRRALKTLIVWLKTTTKEETCDLATAHMQTDTDLTLLQMCAEAMHCLLCTSRSRRDATLSRLTSCT